MKKTIFPFIIALLLIFFMQNATFAGVAEATMIFLQIEPGNRASGMGNAHVAIADDASAAWWNPAGLAYLEHTEVMGTYTDWLPNINLDDLYYKYSASVFPLGKFGAVGLGLTYLNLGETEGRDELNNEVGSFSTYEEAYTLSYGSKVSQNLAAGVNFKSIHSCLVDWKEANGRDNITASAAAIDLGLLYRKSIVPINSMQPVNLSIGANLQNLGDKASYIDRAQADPIPTNLLIGFNVNIEREQFEVNCAFEVSKLLVRKHPDGETDPFYKALFTAWFDEPFFADLIYHGGVELQFMDVFSWRWGFWYDELGKVKPFTLGASLQTPNFDGFQLQFHVSSYFERKGHPLNKTVRYAANLRFPVLFDF